MSNSLGESPVFSINIEYNPDKTFKRLRSRAVKYEKFTMSELVKLSNWKQTISLVPNSNEISLTKRITKLLAERESLIRSMARIKRFQENDISGETTKIRKFQIQRLMESFKQDLDDFLLFKTMIWNERENLKMLKFNQEHGIFDGKTGSYVAEPIVNPFTISYDLLCIKSTDGMNKQILSDSYSTPTIDSDNESQLTFTNSPRITDNQEFKLCSTNNSLFSSSSTPFSSSCSTPLISSNSPSIFLSPNLDRVQSCKRSKVVSNEKMITNKRFAHYHYNPSIKHYQQIGNRKTPWMAKPSTRILFAFLLLFLFLIYLFITAFEHETRAVIFSVGKLENDSESLQSLERVLGIGLKDLIIS